LKTRQKWKPLLLSALFICAYSLGTSQSLSNIELELFKCQAELSLHSDLEKTRSICFKVQHQLKGASNPFYQREFDFILADYYVKKGYVDSVLSIAFLNTPDKEGFTPKQYLKLLILRAQVNLTRASSNECEKYLRPAKGKAMLLALPREQLQIERMLGLMHYYQNGMDSAVFYMNSAIQMARGQNNTIEELRLQQYLISFQNGLSVDNAYASPIELIRYARRYNDLIDLDILGHYGFLKTLESYPLHGEQQAQALQEIVEKATEDNQNQALFYSHMALALLNLHDLKNGSKALLHLKKANTTAPDLWNANPMYALKYCQAGLEFGLKDSLTAILFAPRWASEKAIEVKELLTYLKGKWHQSKGRNDSAVFYFENALKAPVFHDTHVKLLVYQNLSDVMARMGKHQKARHLLQRALNFQDSVKEETIAALVQLKAQLQLDHNRTAERQQNALDSRKSRLNSQRRARRKVFLVSISVLFVSLVLVVIIVLYNRSLGLKRDKERALHQLKLIKSQINPHFQFNALNSIAQLVKNESKNATASVNHFASLSRKVLEQSREAQISLQEEIDLLHEYLALEKLRLKERLIFELRTPESTDLDTILLPPLILQPLVENAVWHSPEEQKTIDIDFTVDAKTLCCKISNPIAPQKRNASPLHTSIGTHLTQERIELYNKASNEQMRFETKVREENGKHIYQCLLHIPIEFKA